MATRKTRVKSNLVRRKVILIPAMKRLIECASYLRHALFYRTLSHRQCTSSIKFKENVVCQGLLLYANVFTVLRQAEDFFSGLELRMYKSGFIIIFVFVLIGWSLLPNALRPFKIYTRMRICRLNFAQRPIFSGLRFFNEPEILDSGPPA